jgi:hypothetical protein
MIELRVRRFFCDVVDCVKKTFAEQVAGLTTRHGRHSIAARRVLLAVALAGVVAVARAITPPPG